MPTTTPELAWWVMTGAIAGLLSLLTMTTLAIAYFLKTGLDRVVARLDDQQVQGQTNAVDVAEHKAACRVMHERLDIEFAELKERRI